MALEKQHNHSFVKEEVGIHILVILGLCVSSVFAHFPWGNYTALFFVVLFLFNLYTYNCTLFIKYLQFFFGFATALVGCLVIECLPTFYLIELRTYSFRTGSFPPLCLAYVLFILTIEITDSRKKVEIRSFRKWKCFERKMGLCDALTALDAVFYIILFLKIAKYPSFILGMDRFAYSDYIALGSTYRIINRLASLMIIFPLISIFYGNKFLGVSGLGLYALYNVWSGNKFGPFFTALNLACLVSYRLIIDNNIRKIKRIIKLLIVMLFILVVLAGALFAFVQKQDNYFFTRLSQQGQLWWKTYDQCQRDGTHLAELGEEFEAIIHGSAAIAENVRSRFGIYKIMYYTAPSEVIDAKLSGGARYTEAGFATAYYYAGMVGCCFFAIVMGVISSLITNGLLKSLSEGNIVAIVLLGRLLSIAAAALSMHEFLGFFDAESIVSYLYLIIMQRPIYFNTFATRINGFRSKEVPFILMENQNCEGKS